MLIIYQILYICCSIPVYRQAAMDRDSHSSCSHVHSHNVVFCDMIKTQNTIITQHWTSLSCTETVSSDILCSQLWQNTQSIVKLFVISVCCILEVELAEKYELLFMREVCRGLECWSAMCSHQCHCYCHPHQHHHQQQR